MTTQTEALKLALEALETAWYHVGTFCPTDEAIELYDDARAAIKEALAQPEQEPVAQWLEDAFREGWASCRDAEFVGEDEEDWKFGNSTANSRMIDLQQSTSPQRTWVALTDEEREDIATEYGLEWLAYRSAFKEVEAKLRSKNNG